MTVLATESTGATRGARVHVYIRGLTMLVAACALVGSTFARFFLAGRQPLWLDETWTGAIAAQQSFGDLARHIYLDVNAPLYYLAINAWAHLFGLSDEALRAPSILIGIAVPLIVLFTPVEGLPRSARLTWAAILALWIPGLRFSAEARGYALLLLLCTGQTLAFVRLMQRPRLAEAAIWAGCSAMAILTHYYAILLGALQGLIYLGAHRERALRTWPAALLFLPAFGWLAFHAARVMEFTRPEIAWYPKLRFSRLGRVGEFLVGAKDLAWWLAAIPVAAGLGGFIPGTGDPEARVSRRASFWAAAAASVVGALIVLAVGFLRPSFVDRYLTPFIPGLALTVVLFAVVLNRRFALTYVAVIVAFAVAAAPWAWRQAHHGWRYYNWQIASQDLMRGQPERLVFLWDHPASAILKQDQLDAVGGFFFRRAGAPVEVRSVVVGRNDDPNPRLLAAAAPERSAIIWAYDVGVQGTAARRFPPRLRALDSRLTCRNYGNGSVGVVACDRFGSVETHP
jgi:hypothetical protein